MTTSRVIISRATFGCGATPLAGWLMLADIALAIQRVADKFDQATVVERFLQKGESPGSERGVAMGRVRWPVTMMTGNVLLALRSRCKISIPFIPGILMSKIIHPTSGGQLVARSRSPLG